MARFRFTDRWAALRTVPMHDAERARLEGRDRQIEDYVSELDRQIDLLGGTIDSALTPYTPTLNNVTEGDGVKSAAFMEAGPLLYIRCRFTLGATSAVTGLIGVSMPGGVSGHEDNVLLARFRDASVPMQFGGRGVFFNDPAFLELRFVQTNTAAEVWGLTTSAQPFTWAVDDWFSVSGWVIPA